MTTLQTVMGFDTSDRAKFRFHVLSVFYISGWKGVHLAFPHLSRATLYRWKKTYERSGKRLQSLVPLSTRPKTTRFMHTPLPLLALITDFRKSYPRMGKEKLRLFVDAFAQAKGISSLSASTIGKIIKRDKLFFAGKGRRKLNQSYRQRIRFCPQADKTTPGYLQLDGIKFYFIDQYYYFLTAIEIVTRQAWVKCIPRLNSTYTAEFLTHVLATSYLKPHTIQTDNGSEFKRYFEEAARKRNLLHLFSYPKHPKTNGYVERFNWTVKDEFLHNAEDLILIPSKFEEALKEWVIYYNQKRPHQSLNYLTPYQFVHGGGCLKSM